MFAGGKEKAFQLENALKVVKISNNLGDAKSLITHPATTTHQRLTDEQLADAGIGQGTLRFSVGLEDVEDLWGGFRAGSGEPLVFIRDHRLINLGVLFPKAPLLLSRCLEAVPFPRIDWGHHVQKAKINVSRFFR